MNEYSFVRTCEYISLCVCVCMRVCMRVCVCVCVFVSSRMSACARVRVPLCRFAEGNRIHEMKRYWQDFTKDGTFTN